MCTEYISKMFAERIKICIFGGNFFTLYKKWDK